jgi:predicted Rossmann fold nucleotide-binding protein DprA/Smf involved in DNA uptake
MPVLSVAEQKVFSCFKNAPITVDELANQTGETIASILTILTLLEVKGCVRAVAGGAYQSNLQL